MNTRKSCGAVLALAVSFAASLLPVHALGAEGASQTVFYGKGRINSPDQQSYALLRQHAGSMIISGNGENVPVDELKRAIGGDFVWFRDGERTFVIVDPALVARANQAWAPYDQLMATAPAARGDVGEREKLRSQRSSAYHQAQVAMRAVIDDAVRAGKATPFPT